MLSKRVSRISNILYYWRYYFSKRNYFYSSLCWHNNISRKLYCSSTIPSTVPNHRQDITKCFNRTLYVSKRYHNEDHTYWNQRWSDGTTIWHKFEIDPMLEKHYDFISKSHSIFVTLCGKSLDMKWLAEKGHTVVGCDIVELAAQQFFTDNNIPFKKYDIEHFTVYESIADKLNIKLLVGDILRCTTQTIGYTFDSIWDCNALVAISPSDRKRYVDTLSSLIKTNGVILLSSYEFQHGSRDYSPFPVPHEDVNKLFNPLNFSVDLKDTADNSGQFCMKYQIPRADRHIYYITKM